MDSDYSTTKVLEFLVDVLNEAERGTGPELNVIPVVVQDDLPSLLPLLTEVCRYAGVPFRLAENLVDGLPWRDPDVLPDNSLRTKIERIELDPTGSGHGENLRVAVDDSILTVRIGTNGSPTNPGDRNQLGLLTALLDPEIRTHAAAVVAYDETDLSDDSKERMWDFVLKDLQTLGPACKTLIVLVGCATLDFERHCREGAGARWAFQHGNVRWRQRSQTDMSGIAKIAADDDMIVLMLGAGASMSSGLPLGDHLRNSALARLVPDLADQGRPFRDQASEFFRQTASLGRLMPSEQNIQEEDFIESLTLERVLREEVRGRAHGERLPTLVKFDEMQQKVLDSPGPSMRDLRALLQLRRRLVLLTVNFDQMIEHDAHVLAPGDDDPLDARSPGPDAASVRMFVTSDDFAAFPAYYDEYKDHGGAVPLIKLHGTIDQPETVRANLDVTLPGLDEHAADLLRHLIPPKGGSIKWVYVGCSMRDPDITAVTQTQPFAHRALETWVSPFIDPHVEMWIAKNRQPAWRAAELPETPRERTITQTADSFFRHFRKMLTS
ncbi:hypothetical protein [Nocardioides sp. Leaf285]|uniref:hypothetical protein n=1 Tax=Nocardioides sp. Leaf285 TaxID=1736322 RepID=UPI0007033DD1|nr:hypothetical protein [Nocardioides sp. Leaf285]